MLLGSAAALLLTFFLIARLSEHSWFYSAFGFEPGNIVPALLVFTLAGGLFSFWFSPISHIFSRRFEYEADRYAAESMGESESLIGALRQLNKQNLSNLTPHPLYSGFYYSHPALLEREQALLEYGRRA